MTKKRVFSTSSRVVSYKQQEFDVLFHVHPCVQQVCDILIETSTPTVKSFDHTVMPVRALEEFDIESKGEIPGLLRVFNEENSRQFTKLLVANTLREFNSSIHRFPIRRITGTQVRGYSETYVGDVHVPYFCILKSRDPVNFKRYRADVSVNGVEASVFVSQWDDFYTLLQQVKQHPQEILDHIFAEVLYTYSDKHYVSKMVSVAELSKPSESDKQKLLCAGKDNILCVVNHCYVYFPYLVATELVLRFHWRGYPVQTRQVYRPSFASQMLLQGIWFAPVTPDVVMNPSVDSPDAASIIESFVMENFYTLREGTGSTTLRFAGTEWKCGVSDEMTTYNFSISTPVAGPFVVIILCNGEVVSAGIVPGVGAVNHTQYAPVYYVGGEEIQGGPVPILIYKAGESPSERSYRLHDTFKFTDYTLPLSFNVGYNSLAVVLLGVANSFYTVEGGCYGVEPDTVPPIPIFNMPDVLLKIPAITDELVPVSTLQQTVEVKAPVSVANIRDELPHVAKLATPLYVAREISEHTVHYVVATKEEIQHAFLTMHATAPIESVSIIRGVLHQGKLQSVVKPYSSSSVYSTCISSYADFCHGMRQGYEPDDRKDAQTVRIYSVSSEVRLRCVYKPKAYIDKMELAFGVNFLDKKQKGTVYLDIFLYKDSSELETYDKTYLTSVLQTTAGCSVVDNAEEVRHGLRLALDLSAKVVTLHFKAALEVYSFVLRWIASGEGECDFDLQLVYCMTSIEYRNMFLIATQSAYKPIGAEIPDNALVVHADSLQYYLPSVFKWEALPEDIKYFSSIVILADKVQSLQENCSSYVYEVENKLVDGNVYYLLVPTQEFCSTPYRVCDARSGQCLAFCKVLVNASTGEAVAHADTNVSVTVDVLFGSDIVKGLYCVENKWIEVTVPNLGWHTYTVQYEGNILPCCGVNSHGETVADVKDWDTFRIRVQLPSGVQGKEQIQLTLQSSQGPFSASESGELLPSSFYSCVPSLIGTSVLAVQIPFGSRKGEVKRIRVEPCSLDEMNMSSLDISRTVVYGVYRGTHPLCTVLDVGVLELYVDLSSAAVVDASSKDGCVAVLLEQREQDCKMSSANTTTQPLILFPEQSKDAAKGEKTLLLTAGSSAIQEKLYKLQRPFTVADRESVAEWWNVGVDNLQSVAVLAVVNPSCAMQEFVLYDNVQTTDANSRIGVYRDTLSFALQNAEEAGLACCCGNSTEINYVEDEQCYQVSVPTLRYSITGTMLCKDVMEKCFLSFLVKLGSQSYTCSKKLQFSSVLDNGTHITYTITVVFTLHHLLGSATASVSATVVKHTVYPSGDEEVETLCTNSLSNQALSFVSRFVYAVVSIPLYMFDWSAVSGSHCFEEGICSQGVPDNCVLTAAYIIPGGDTISVDLLCDSSSSFRIPLSSNYQDNLLTGADYAVSTPVMTVSCTKVYAYVDDLQFAGAGCFLGTVEEAVQMYDTLSAACVRALNSSKCVSPIVPYTVGAERQEPLVFSPSTQVVLPCEIYTHSQYKIIEPTIVHRYTGTQEFMTEEVRAIT